jgi:UDP-N-acetylmuramoyl-tripeptide--D-alanyl-D-alanine ligase
VVGVTGSTGKTSTKDLLAAVLGAAADTVAPAGNLNNELGVPLTVCRVDPGTRFLVAEMGARGIGHIRYLCSIAPPDVGVVLNVGQAHVGEFGGKEAIAQAKGELVEALPPTGTAVLHADDPLVWAMRSRTRARVLPFAVGADPGGDEAVWAADLVGDERGRYAFVLHARTGRLYQAEPVRLLGTGRHQVANATAAAAAALALGLDLTGVAAALGTAERASRWRMEVTDRADGVTVLNDAYNASPDSMRAAVETLVEIARRRPGRSWAVLGDMLEMGDEAPAAHVQLGRQVAAAGVDELVVLGAYAPALAEAAEGVHTRVAATKEEALSWLRAEVSAGDVVLVKASRGLALETVAEDLLAVPVPSPDRVVDPHRSADPDRRKD